MSNKAIYLAIGLVTGVVVSAWYVRSPDSQSIQETLPDAQAESVEARFVEIENVVAEQFEFFRDEIESLRSDLTVQSEASAEPVAPPLQLPADAAEFVTRVRALAQKGGAIEALTEAGFSLSRAQEIERRREEHRVAALQARYEAARSGDSSPLGNAEIEELFDADSMLRSELGDADFERYLEAMGRPTEVPVMSVLSSSAAQQAGMLVGDQIVAYDGYRVFHIRELTEFLVEGEPGVPVIVDIVRDGQAMQLVLPRGPLGIMAAAGPITTFAPADQE